MSLIASPSATTPWPANAASPWISTGSTGTRPGGSIWSCSARTMPSTIGPTVSRWLGLAASSTLDVGAGRADVLALHPEVVLDVAGALHRVGVDVALELGEDRLVALAHDVRQHVEPAAVGHAEHARRRNRRRRRSTGSRRGSGSPTRRPRCRTAWCRRTWWRGTSRTTRRRSAARGCGPSRPWSTARASPSTLAWIQTCSSVSWMCMYSTPIVRQYASRSTPSRSPRRILSTPPTPSVRNSRSRSQIVRP